MKLKRIFTQASGLPVVFRTFFPLFSLFLLFTLQTASAEEIEEPTSVVEKGALDTFLHSNHSFANVSFNYLDWFSGTTRDTGKKDFVYLELEGGAGWDWGDFYFFMDLENPTRSWNGDKAPDNMRFVIKPKLNVNLGNTGLLFHIQNYFLIEDDFYVNNLVPAIAYNLFWGNLWFQPFIGGHYQISDATYFDAYTGWNGCMAGWVLNYDFTVFEQKMAISQWHDHEFARDKEFYLAADGTRVGDGSKQGFNGAVALWWHINNSLTTGIQYRYADHKLGSQEYQDGLIYTVRYNF